MRPLEAALHVVSLTACVGLGAGLWSLRQERATAKAPAPAAPAAADRTPRLEQDLKALASQLESLTLRLQQVESGARAAQAPAAATVTAEDPRAQEQIRLMVDRALKEIEARDEAEMRKQMAEAAKTAGHAVRIPGLPSGFDVLLGGGGPEDLDLNDTQKEAMAPVLAESRKAVMDLSRKVRAKELTSEQAKAELARRNTETDARVQALLTAEQFKRYQEGNRITRAMDEQLVENGGTGHAFAVVGTQVFPGKAGEVPPGK